MVENGSLEFSPELVYLFLIQIGPSQLRQIFDDCLSNALFSLLSTKRCQSLGISWNVTRMINTLSSEFCI